MHIKLIFGLCIICLLFGCDLSEDIPYTTIELENGNIVECQRIQGTNQGYALRTCKDGFQYYAQQNIKIISYNNSED